MKYEMGTRLDLKRVHQKALKRMPRFVEAHNPLKKHLSSHLLLYSSSILSKKNSPTSKHPAKKRYLSFGTSITQSMRKRTNLKRIHKTPFFLLLPLPKAKALFFFSSLSPTHLHSQLSCFFCFLLNVAKTLMPLRQWVPPPMRRDA